MMSDLECLDSSEDVLPLIALERLPVQGGRRFQTVLTVQMFYCHPDLRPSRGSRGIRTPRRESPIGAIRECPVSLMERIAESLHNG